MDSRYAVTGRSSLFSRRANLGEAGGGGGGGVGGGYEAGGGAGGVGGRVGRYNRNRFAKLDLGRTTTTDSFDSAPRIEKYDFGKLGLYSGSGRLSRYEGTPLTGNTGIFDFGRFGGTFDSTLNNGTSGFNDNQRSDRYDFGLTRANSNGTTAAYYGGTVEEFNDGANETYYGGTSEKYSGTHDGTNGTSYGGTTEKYNDDVTGVYRREITGTYNVGTVGTYGEGVCMEGVSSDDVIYYRLIDNYTIWKLETVESSAALPLASSTMTTPLSTPPATPSALKSFGLSLSSIRCTSGDAPVQKKLNLIKNLQILIEELQQKVARLQLEVEEQDIATSFCNSKFGFNRLKDSSSESSDSRPTAIESSSTICYSSSSPCDVNECRHLEELELLKKRNDHLQQEKFHLEEQIVQLRSLKSIVHGTDSEKRVTKLEAENVQLQTQLKQTIDQLRQQQEQQQAAVPATGGGGGARRLEVAYPNVASTVQQYESRNSEMESRINDVVQRLKERHRLTESAALPSTSTTSSPSSLPPSAAQHHNHLSPSAESQQLQLLKNALLQQLHGTTIDAQQVADELKQTKHQCIVLQRWLAGQIENIMLQVKLLSKGLGCSSVNVDRPRAIIINNNNYDNTNSNDKRLISSSSPQQKPISKEVSSSVHHQHQQQLSSSLSAADAATDTVALDTHRGSLLADEGRLRNLASPDPQGRTTDHGPEIDSKCRDGGLDLGSTDDDQMSLKQQPKDKLLTEAKEGIRVLCHVRPVLKDEQGSPECILPPSTATTTDSSSAAVVQLMYRGRLKTFEVDHIIPATDDSQEKVFEEVRGPLVSCFDGQNVNVIAYGETGSGKTFTLQGTAEKPGVVQRAVGLLLAEVKRRRTEDDNIDCQLTLSIIEIYNEAIRDLLNSDPNHRVDIKPSSDGSASIPGLTRIPVESQSDATKILKRGQDSRCSKQMAPDHTSRSHLIMTINVTEANRTNQNKTYGRVNLVDLAGSERIEKTGVDAARLKEAQSVNKSLTCLGDVLYALLAKQTHVPFRSSKLTHVLQDALAGSKSSTMLIAHVASVDKRASETMSTLMFAQRVRAVDSPSTSLSLKGGPSSEGGSGSRTPVEPISQRPRRPSASGISDRMSIFASLPSAERRTSISSERKGPLATPGSSSTKRPSGNMASASAVTSATAQARERSKSRTENRMTTGGGYVAATPGTPPISRPRSSLKFLPPTPKK